MGVNIKNAEGYYDPTTFEALTNIEKERKQKEYDLNKFRPLVYICSPFSGDVEKNVEAAKKYSRAAVEKGYIPITRNTTILIKCTPRHIIRKITFLL